MATAAKRSKPTFSIGDIVWADLGFSYGWWPAEVAKPKENKENADVNVEVSSTKNAAAAAPSDTDDSEVLHVKFFDDDNLERYRLPSASTLVKPYACKDRLELVRKGLMKFSVGGDCGGGVAKNLGENRTRLSQFVKDVEMAEVMSGSDPEVVELLQMHVDLDQEEDVPEEVQQPKPTAKGRGKKKGATKRKRRC
jgi:hypothetical protein